MNLNHLFATKTEYGYWNTLVESLTQELITVISNSLYTIHKHKQLELIACAGPVGSGKTQIAALFQYLQPECYEVITMDKVRYDFETQNKPWVLRELSEIKQILIERLTEIKNAGKIPVLDSVMILSENDRWFVNMINKPSTLLFRLRAIPHHILIPDAVERHYLRIKEGHVYSSRNSEDDQDKFNTLKISFAGNAIMHTVNTVYDKTTSCTLFLNDGNIIPQEVKQELVEIGKIHRNDVLTQYRLIEPIVKQYPKYAFVDICRQVMQRLNKYN